MCRWANIKMVLIIAFANLFFGCNFFKSNQEKAEIAIKRYQHVSLDSDSAKKMKFTKLEGHTIGLINGYKLPSPKSIPDSFVLRKTLWFEMDASYSEIVSVLVR